MCIIIIRCIIKQLELYLVNMFRELFLRTRRAKACFKHKLVAFAQP